MGANSTDEDGGGMPAAAPLPRPIQEHLGRQLRSVYNEATPKPAFLGDSDLPPQFERLIRRIETSERVHEVGIDAVRKALGPNDPA